MDVAVRNRLVAYRAQTAPVVDWYEDHGANVVRVDAVGTLDQVRDRILRALARA